MELYRIILQSFGVDNHSYQVSRMVKNIRELVLEMASRKVTPLLIIDEAHLLKKNVFTELHTLIQFDHPPWKAFAPVLVQNPTVCCIVFL